MSHSGDNGILIRKSIESILKKNSENVAEESGIGMFCATDAPLAK